MIVFLPETEFTSKLFQPFSSVHVASLAAAEWRRVCTEPRCVCQRTVPCGRTRAWRAWRVTRASAGPCPRPPSASRWRWAASRSAWRSASPRPTARWPSGSARATGSPSSGPPGAATVCATPSGPSPAAGARGPPAPRGPRAARAARVPTGPPRATPSAWG